MTDTPAASIQHFGVAFLLIQNYSQHYHYSYKQLIQQMFIEDLPCARHHARKIELSVGVERQTLGSTLPGEGGRQWNADSFNIV